MFSLEVISPSGKNLFGGLPKIDGGSGVVVTVPPQGAYGYRFPLGRLSEYKTNGVYKIIAKRKVLHGLTAASNPLELKVVPGEWKEPNPDSLFP
jgi:hypothetical protein